MDEVIEHCQTTFEEEGVDGKTLEELRSVSVPSLGTFPSSGTPMQHSLCRRKSEGFVLASVR